MEVYLLTAEINWDGEYQESVATYKDMVEKPSSYHKKGVRLLKSDLGIIKAGWNKYTMLVLNQDDFEPCFKILKEKMEEDILQHITKYTKKLEAITNHDESKGYKEHVR